MAGFKSAPQRHEPPIAARFARGWHCLGPQAQFADGKPHRLQAFGRNLIVHLDQASRLSVLESSCNHFEAIGAHLEKGIDSAGAPCPISDCSHPQPEVSRWDAHIQDGLLFAWHDPSGTIPNQELAVPSVSGFTDSSWTDWAWAQRTVQVQARKVVEHLVDLATSQHVNGSRPVFFKNVFQDHIATQYFEGPVFSHCQPASGTTSVSLARSVASYFGPSVLLGQLEYAFDDSDLPVVILHAHFPIDEYNTVLMAGVQVQGTADPRISASQIAAELVQKIITASDRKQQLDGLPEMSRDPQPARDEEPLLQLRRWYQQFHLAESEIPAESTDRFEYEVDSTMPIDVWNRSSARTLILHKPTGKQLV